MGWHKRVEIMRNVADIMEERLFDLAALMAYEVGKSRLEALGDVQETAELIRWNADEMEKHDGFRTPMSGLGAAGDYYDVLRPYGVWAVISPFNFPMALSGGPSGGALVAGNAVVLKPSNQGALIGLQALRVLPRRRRAPGRVPPDDRAAAQLAGDHLWKHPDVGGITFTGSYPVGMDIYKHFATEIPKPVICEMGGKNPAIVTKNADLDKATDGVLRSAFGFGGQKCSACSRVFVEREVYDDFLGLLKQKTEKLKVGNPLERDVYIGPIINEPAMETFEEAVRGGAEDGNDRHRRPAHHRGRLRARATSSSRPSSRCRRTTGSGSEELFVPFVAVGAFDELDEAIEKANDTEYGLTAGLLLRGSGRDRRVPRPDPGGRRLREPPRRARRPARGRACSRSAAGRAAGPPARPAAAPTTSRCTCASSRRTVIADEPGATSCRPELDGLAATRRARRSCSPTFPGPNAQEVIERDGRVDQPVAAAGVPARAQARRRAPWSRTSTATSSWT